LAALVMIAPVGNAHAEFIHGYVNGQYVSGHVHTGPQGWLRRRAGQRGGAWWVNCAASRRKVLAGSSGRPS
jgi:hypothetical protein